MTSFFISPLDNIKIIAYNYSTMYYNTHYSGGVCQDMFELAGHASRRANDIHNDFKAGGKFSKYIPILVYSGMSGVSTATAIAMKLHEKHLDKIGMIYVRKESETSHGNSIEYRLHDTIAHSKQIGILIFVDDFSASGATGHYVIEKCLNLLSRTYPVTIAIDKHKRILAAMHNYYAPMVCLSTAISKSVKERGIEPVIAEFGPIV